MDLDDDTVFFSKSIAPELVFLVPEEAIDWAVFSQLEGQYNRTSDTHTCQ